MASQRNQQNMKEEKQKEGLLSQEDLNKVGAVALAAVGGLCAVDIVRYTTKAANGESTEDFNSYTWNTLKAITSGWQENENEMKGLLKGLGLQDAGPVMDNITQAIQRCDK